MQKKYPAPLSGLKVLDFTEVLSGPYCTQLLGDLGAEVIKVEPPWGDETRRWCPPFIGHKSAYFFSLNRNKKSIALDLSKEKPGGRMVALALARRCDVLVESFRPGVMKRLGLDYESIKKVNPAIIFCSISGYGQFGPLSHKPGYDIAAYAASGIMSITGEEKGGPVKTGVPIADIGAGLTAALAICATLSSRKGSQGTHIDVSLYDTLISWLTFQAGYYFATGKNPKKLGSAHPLLVPYQAFLARDRFFILAVGNDAMWQRACNAIGREDLGKDRRFTTEALRVSHRGELVSLLEKILRKKSASYWLATFDKAGVPCSPIQTVKEALNSEHTLERGLVIELGARKGKTIAPPIHFLNATSTRTCYLAPPNLGENSLEILKGFGFKKTQIEKLLRGKIVFEGPHKQAA